MYIVEVKYFSWKKCILKFACYKLLNGWWQFLFFFPLSLCFGCSWQLFKIKEILSHNMNFLLYACQRVIILLYSKISIKSTYLHLVFQFVSVSVVFRAPCVAYENMVANAIDLNIVSFSSITLILNTKKSK